MDPNGPGPKKTAVVALETVELSESDDDFEYAAVDVPSDDDAGEGSDDEAVLSALRPVRRASAGSTVTGKLSGDGE